MSMNLVYLNIINTQGDYEEVIGPYKKQEYIYIYTLHIMLYAIYEYAIYILICLLCLSNLYIDLKKPVYTLCANITK